jgi:hypothetical protein
MSPDPDALMPIRGLISAIQAQRRELEAAGPSRDELIREADALVDHLEAEGRRRLLASLQTQPANPFRVAGLGNGVDIGPLLVGLLGATVKEALRALLMELPEGLPPMEKAERLLTLHNEQLALEKREEALVRELEAAGQPVQRRADASPAVVLGLMAVK